MPLYVALHCGVDTPPARRGALLRDLQQHYPALVRQENAFGIDLFCRLSNPPQPVRTNQSGSLLLIGSLFERGTARNGPSAPANLALLDGDPDQIARTLVDDHWGSYLAFLRCPQTGAVSVLRDPSGAIPAVVAGDETLRVVADQIPRWLHEAVVGKPSIDWDLVATQLTDPSTASHRSFLAAIRPIVAGSLVALRGNDRPRHYWLPNRVATRRAPQADRLEHDLRYVVRDCVAALTHDHDRLLLELSGGLDSAILLGSLADRHANGPPACINFATAHPSGDERAYARAAADRVGAMLTEAMLDAADMDYRGLANQADLSELRLYGSDATHERVVSALAEAIDASAIVSGQGGDAVFFQEPTPLVAADHLAAKGLNRSTWRTVVDSADRSYRSVWAVLAAARAARRHHAPLVMVEHDNLLLGPAARSAGTAPGHPWLADIDALPPAKRVQLQLLAACQFFRGPTARADRFTLIQPLLAQPIVELCLAIPSWKLAFGRHDRALARAAFSDDIPDLIGRRRGKGEVSSYYSHAILANLPFLRDLLLGGLLVDRGMLDGTMLDTALTEASLVQRPDHRVIIAYASLEGWLRSWS